MNIKIKSNFSKPFSPSLFIKSFSWGFVLLIGFIFSMSSTLHAETQDQSETHKIYLSHHEFEAWTFKPQPNDRIDIINQSDISHSIYITAPDGTITSLDVQLPGATVSWKVPASGEYKLQCWIHPIIHATLSVTATTNLSKR